MASIKVLDPTPTCHAATQSVATTPSSARQFNLFSAEKSSKAGLARGKATGSQKNHPATSEIDYTPEELEFMAAIREFQNASGKKFPSWSDALRVAKSIGFTREPAPAQPAPETKEGPPSEVITSQGGPDQSEALERSERVKKHWRYAGR